jgi:outer membrane receptor protein involved in Fe transport
MPLRDDLTLEIGADFRQVEGATNERFFVKNNKFSRMRNAGGEQMVTGAFAEVNWEVLSGLTVTAGGRVDYWRQSDGSRLETNISDGSIRRNDVFPTRDGAVGNFRVGARSELTNELTFKALAYSGFRVPTINELYRPFRVGSDITEANPNLKLERLWGVEGGIEWTPVQALTLSTGFFHVWINDAVSNTTITTTPGFNAELGAFVPTGGSLRQRRNVDRIEVDGAEAEAVWALSDQINFALGYLYSSPKVKRNVDDPTLVGNRLAQVARHQGTLAATWRPNDQWTLKVEGRAVSSQFDDDQNLRRLRGFAVLDLYADMAITDYATLFVSAENVFDRTIEAGLSGSGLVTVGLPRVVAGGLRMSF